MLLLCIDGDDIPVAADLGNPDVPDCIDRASKISKYQRDTHLGCEGIGFGLLLVLVSCPLRLAGCCYLLEMDDMDTLVYVETLSVDPPENMHVLGTCHVHQKPLFCTAFGANTFQVLP